MNKEQAVIKATKMVEILKGNIDRSPQYVKDYIAATLDIPLDKAEETILAYGKKIGIQSDSIQDVLDGLKEQVQNAAGDQVNKLWQVSQAAISEILSKHCKFIEVLISIGQGIFDLLKGSGELPTNPQTAADGGGSGPLPPDPTHPKG